MLKTKSQTLRSQVDKANIFINYSQVNFDNTALYKKGERTAIVVTVINRISDAISSIPFFVARNGKDVTSEYRFLTYPNSFYDFNILINKFVKNYILSGEVFIEIAKISKNVESISVIDSIEFSNFNNNSSNVYFDNANNQYSKYQKNVKTDENEVLLYHNALNKNGTRGLSLLYSCQEAIVMIEKAGLFNISALENGGLITYQIIYNDDLTATETGDDGITISKYERVKEWVKSLYGGTSNAGKFAITDSNTEIKQLGFSPKDLAYEQAIQKSEASIVRLLGASMGAIGDITDQNYNTLAEQVKNFYSSCVLSYVSKIEKTINQLIKDGDVFKFDTSEISALQTSQTEKAQILTQMYNDNILTKNEYREQLGWSAIKNGEQFKDAK